MKKIFPLLDAGHGGMVGGKYVTAPYKMFQHKDGSIAYEGVITRKIKNSLITLLQDNGIEFFDVVPVELDMSLSSRVSRANAIYRKKRDTHNVVYLSIHSNAGNGRGFEVWTSPGYTASDKYADLWAKSIMNQFPDLPLRSDKSDGDLDKEAKFKVLVDTECPAVLAEYLFFDNVDDWALLRTDSFIEGAAQSIFDFIVKADMEFRNGIKL